VLVFLPCALCTPLLFLPKRVVPYDSLLDLLVWSLESAGPVYIKLAQWASTRRDIFPESICNRLSRLQRDTKPHSWHQTMKILNMEWGNRWEESVLVHKDVIGSGCCAQVYKGKVGSKNVAVKVVHPGLADQLELDLSLMKIGAKTLTFLLPDVHWLNLEEAVKEFQLLMMGQVNMMQEAANLLKFRNNFQNSQRVHFPEPVMELCGSNVLVEDWMDGIGIQNYTKFSGVETEELKRDLAEVGVDMLLKMVFTDNYWHGDLHPGNILVHEDKLCVLDTGVVGSLSEGDRFNLIHTFRAVVVGDSNKVAELFLERSYHECKDVDAFKKELAAIVDEARGTQLSLDRIDACQLLQNVFSTLMRHKVRLDANFSSVVIAIAIVEGLGRSLDPQLDLVRRAMPYLLL